MDENILIGKTLLVVDDETDLRDIVASELEFMGAKVYQAENISTAKRVLSLHDIDLIISDIRMPGGTGIDLLDFVKAKNPSLPPVILITGFADITTEDAFDKGAEALLNKPFKLDELIKMVIRYTSSFMDKFSEPVDSQKKIESSEDSEIKFGRGGFNFEIDTAGKKFDVGELVDFDFSYHDKKFVGTAVCRWFKHKDHGSHKATVGLEFMKLNDLSLNQFQTMLDGKKIIPYIPSSKTQSLIQ